MLLFLVIALVVAAVTGGCRRHRDDLEAEARDQRADLIADIAPSRDDQRLGDGPGRDQQLLGFLDRGHAGFVLRFAEHDRHEGRGIDGDHAGSPSSP